MPYRLVPAPPPARKSPLTRVADGMRNRVGVLLALAVALAMVAGAAAVVAPTSIEAAALSARSGSAGASAPTGRGAAVEHADRAERQAPGAGTSLHPSRPRSAAQSQGTGTTQADTSLAAASSADPASSTSTPASPFVGSGDFPGAPTAGHIIWGAAVGLNTDPRARHEAPTGTPVGIHRIYFNAGAGDLAVPSGPAARAILADQAAGRIPLISVKPGPFASTAAGAYDSQFRAFFAWTERQAKYTYVIVNHEPENDLKGAPMAAQVQLASDFRHAQERVRADLDAVTGGHATRTSFGGSLMTYSDTPHAQKGFAPWDQFFPPAGTWDWAGMDFYTEPTQSPTRQEWTDAVAAAGRHGVRLAVTELGFRATDPLAASRLKAFYEEALRLGVPFVSYFDSNQNGAYANTWTLQGSQFAEFNALMTDPRSVTPNR